MKELLEIAKNAKKNIREAGSCLSNEDKDRVIKKIIELSDSNFEKFFNELFVGLDNWESCFYQIVQNLQLSVGFRDRSNLVASRLWIHAYQRIKNPERQEVFLNAILNDEKKYIWHMIRALPDFCTKIKLPFVFAAKWFYELAERVKNDLAGGGVFEGVENSALTFPLDALKIFDIYRKKLTDETIMHLASLVLGCVRCQKKENIRKIDTRLKLSKDVKEKICYYSSIFISYKNGAITLKQLSTLLDHMLADESQEVNDIAFLTVRKGLVTNKKGFERFGISWFDKNCSQAISGSSKYQVISCMWHICSDRAKRPTINYQNANRIIAQILPVPNEHLGTLDELSNYLCYGLKGADELTEAISAFIPNGIDNILCLLTHDKYEHFRHELHELDLTELCTNLIFSGDPQKCKLGFLFLEHSKVSTSLKITIKDEALSVALSQLTRERNLNETIAKKVIFLEPFFRTASKKLQSEFVDEAVIQAANYSQGCLEVIKCCEHSDLLNAIIERAERYFEGFRKSRNSPANGFNFPGYYEACKKAQIKLNAKIRKYAEKKSVFMSLVHKVSLIYGHDFSFTTGNTISDASPMTQYEKSMELPRLELIDPEGMTIRSIQVDK